MPRQTLDFTVIKPTGSKYYKGKIRGWKNYRSTGETTKAKAERVVRMWYDESRLEEQLTFGDYASQFYRPGCPHCSRLEGDDRSITDEHKGNRRRNIKNYLLPDPLSRISLQDIRRNDFLEFRSRIHSLKLAKATKNKIVGTAKTILREALFRELINRDITAGIGQLKEDDRQSKSLPTVDELHRLLTPGDHWQSELARLGFIIATSTGMRRGEIVALRWDRVQNGIITIDRGYKAPGSPGGSGSYDELPKWGRIRKIPAPSILLDTLEKWPRLGDYVLTRPSGQPATPRWWNWHWNEATTALGIRRPGLVPHSLRHFVNSWLLNKGFPPQHIRAYLGWSDTSDIPDSRITRVQNVYLHIEIEKLKPLAEEMSRMISFDKNGKPSGITTPILNKV